MNNKISFEDILKIDFRVGTIIEVEEVEGSEKLLKLSVEFGELGSKTIVAGIAKYYSIADLLNKKSVFVVNSEPRSIMGIMSEGMIFGAKDEAKDEMSLLLLDKELENGAKVF